MTELKHVYLVISGYKGISKVQRSRWDPEDYGKILGVYPTAELAEEHANKLVELIKHNMSRIDHDDAIVKGDGWNKAVITDGDDRFAIHWVSIEGYEIHTEVKIE